MSMVDPLSPWAEGTEDGTPERQLSRLLGAVPEPTALSELSRQRVAMRLRAPTSRRLGLALVRLVAVGVVIGLTGAAFAQWASVRWFGAQHELVRPSRVVVAAPKIVPQPSLPTQPLSPPVDEAPTPVADLPSSAAFPAAAASVGSSRLGLEAASLEAALSALRGGGAERAQKALRALDQHLRDFPAGALELEARVARVDALLTLGRRQDARRELSALPIERVGRKNELRLIRAELRADDDCGAALSDFQVLVDAPLPAAFAERALFGRGACLLKLGDHAGAERDFARYLERFPSGRFAAQIRAQSSK
jgi:hypothetical protein